MYVNHCSCKVHKKLCFPRNFFNCIYFWYSNWKYFAVTDLSKRIVEYS
jgi:hypothetical protein